MLYIAIISAWLSGACAFLGLWLLRRPYDFR